MRAPSWLAAVALLVASHARAQDAEDDVPPPPPTGYQESIPPAPGARSDDAAPARDEADPATPAAEDPPEDSGARMHDGFHLRMALGFGGVTDSMTGTIPPTTLEYDAKAGGGSVAFHLGIGGEVAEGLTLGGYLLSETVTNPEAEFEGTPVKTTIDVGTLGMLGVFLDWYPDAHGGFHFGGGLGGAGIRTTDNTGKTSDPDEQPAGGGFTLLIGYDWWVGDEWSLGILGRITGAGMRGGDVDHDVGALSVLFSVLHH